MRQGRRSRGRQKSAARPNAARSVRHRAIPQIAAARVRVHANEIPRFDTAIKRIPRTAPRRHATRRRIQTVRGWTMRIGGRANLWSARVLRSRAEVWRSETRLSAGKWEVVLLRCASLAHFLICARACHASTNIADSLHHRPTLSPLPCAMARQIWRSRGRTAVPAAAPCVAIGRVAPTRRRRNRCAGEPPQSAAPGT